MSNTSDGVPVAVDRDRCVGVGQCELLEPTVFQVDDDDGLSVVIGTGRLDPERAAVVIDKCPSGAIHVVADP